MNSSSRRTSRGQYRNEHPTVQASVREALMEWRGNKAPTKPTGPVPIESRTGAEFDVPPASGLRVTWLGHATSLVEIDGRRILIDPLWADRASPFQFIGPKRFFPPPLPLDDLPPLDAVLLSHDHYDHLDRRTVLALGRTGVRIFTPLGVGKRIIRWGLPARQVTELDWWEQADAAGVTVTATPSRHFSGRSPLFFDRDRALWAGFALTGDAHRVYYASDTAMFGGFDEIGRRLGPFDVALIEIGAYNRLWPDVHLGPEQAVEAFRRVRGGLFFPIHWATFDLSTHGWTEPVERLLAEVDRTGIPVVVPRPGQSVEPAEPPEVERWWPDLPWRTAEEYPVVSSGPIPPRSSTTTSST